MTAPTFVHPHTAVSPVTEVFHGIEITDPYRWLEDGDSSETAAWIAEQTLYTRSFLDSIPGRARIRNRVEELMAVDSYDTPWGVAERTFFLKRRACQQQPGIYVIRSDDAPEELLVSPEDYGEGGAVSVAIVDVSPDGKFLAFSVRRDGSNAQEVEIFDVESHCILADRLPRGRLVSFAFDPGREGYYYTLEPLDTGRPGNGAVLRHRLGTALSEDEEIFSAGADGKLRLAFRISPDGRWASYSIKRYCGDVTYEFHLQELTPKSKPIEILRSSPARLAGIWSSSGLVGAHYSGSPNGRIVRIGPPFENSRGVTTIVEERPYKLVQLAVAKERILAVYVIDGACRAEIFDTNGQAAGSVHLPENGSIRLMRCAADHDRGFAQFMSFTQPPTLYTFRPSSGECVEWRRKNVSFDAGRVDVQRVTYQGRDKTAIPMSLVGRDVKPLKPRPVILTAYGAYGRSITPQFTAYGTFFVERGCLWAIANIRGGGEFGHAWHDAGRRQNKQNSIDDFLAAAEWLIREGFTTPQQLAIVGGSSAGLLVAAAVTQRPELFRCALSLGPLLDMLRYHHCGEARAWREEFGTADDANDFGALYAYSPYHRVEEGSAYPAMLFVSGHVDDICDPMHARKMTARMQSANTSTNPILLDYLTIRGHAPVMPLDLKVAGLTDRLAFLCDQLEVTP